MRTNTSMALPLFPPRNRLMLAAAMVIAAPIAGLATGAFVTTQSNPRAVLTNISETPLSVGSDNTPSIIKTDASELNSDIRWFNGRPVRPVRTMPLIVTAYSHDARSCGDSADNITASGYSVWTNGMRMAAADTSILPFGTLISVPGYDSGNVVPVLDRGGAIKGHRLDMLYPTHAQARVWGVKQLEITVWEYADGLPSGFKTRFNSASAVKN